MKKFNIVTINRYLLYKQHLLAGSGTQSIVQVADDLCGLHATCPSTPYLSLFARMNNFSKHDLIIEVEEKKSLIRTRSVRNTLHLLPASNSSMVFAATKFQQNRRSEKYIKHLGISMDEFRSIEEKIMLTLSGRGLTANEIKRETGNSMHTSHVINILCDEGILVRGQINGGWKSNNHRYFLFGDFFKDIVKKEINEKDAVKSLILNYLKTYGPVTAEDISWWSGTGKTILREILTTLDKKIRNIFITGNPDKYLMLKSDYIDYNSFKIDDMVSVHYLPALDPFVMGYKLRDRFIDSASYDYVFDRYGNASPTIICDSKIIGIWDTEEKERLIKFYLFQEAEDFVYEKVIETGLKTAGFYFNQDADILQIRKTIPVKELTVGSFMSPLKNTL